MNLYSVVSFQDDVPPSGLLSLLIPAGELDIGLVQHFIRSILRLYSINTNTHIVGKDIRQ